MSRPVVTWVVGPLALVVCLAAGEARAHPPTAHDDGEVEAVAEAEPQPPLPPLLIDDVPAMETVVDVALPSAAASSQTLSRQQLADQNTRSAEDLLRRVPGVQVVQHGAEGKAPQLLLRGVDAIHGSDIELTLDGIPLNEPGHVHGHGYLDLSFIVPELVDAVGVDKGAFRLRQGPFSTAGALHYRLRARRPGITVTTEGGTPLRGRTAVVAAQGPRRFVAAEGVRSVGFGDGRAVSRAGLNAVYDLPLTSWLSVDASVFGAAARFGLPGAVRADDVQARRVGIHDSYQRGEGSSTRLLSAVGAHLHLGEVSAHARTWLGLKHAGLRENFTGDLQQPGRGDTLAQRQEHVDVGSRALLSWRVLAPLTFNLLGEARVVAADQRQSLPATGGFEAESLQHDLTLKTSVAGGGSVVWRPSRWLRSELSLRADAFQIARSPAALASTGSQASADWGAALSPRLSVSASPGISGVRTFVSVGRGVRPPATAGPVSQPDDLQTASFDVLTGRWGDVHTVETAEVGAVWRRQSTTLAAAAFGALSTGEVLFDHVARTTTVAGASRRLGLEARAAWSLSRFIDVSADLTAVDARLIGSLDDGVGALLIGGEPVPGVPHLSGALRGAIEPLEGLRLGLSTVALSPRPLRYGAVAPPMVVVNGFARLRLGRVSVELAADNVLDAAYAEGAGMFASHWDAKRAPSQLPVQHWYAGSPRMLRAGLSVDL